MSALEPCPFCSGDAEFLPDHLMAPGAEPPVFCNGCHASALNAAAWNRRHVPPGFALVPVEPTTEQLQDGQMAGRKARKPSVSGMTIDAQVRAECAVEAAIYRAMIATLKEPAP